jgi:hypothetical protein
MNENLDNTGVLESRAETVFPQAEMKMPGDLPTSALFKE